MRAYRRLDDQANACAERRTAEVARDPVGAPTFMHPAQRYVLPAHHTQRIGPTHETGSPPWLGCGVATRHQRPTNWRIQAAMRRKVLAPAPLSSTPARDQSGPSGARALSGCPSSRSECDAAAKRKTGPNTAPFQLRHRVDARTGYRPRSRCPSVPPAAVHGGSAGVPKNGTVTVRNLRCRHDCRASASRRR